MTNDYVRRPSLRDQVANIIRNQIQVSYKVGDRLKSIRELATEFSTSTLTVSEALSALENEGQIERKKGKGTFVTTPYLKKSVFIYFYKKLHTSSCTASIRHIIDDLNYLLRINGYETSFYFGECLQTFHKMILKENRKNYGVIFLSDVNNKLLLEFLEKENICTLGIGSHFELGVHHDYQKMLSHSIEYLLNLKFKKIAMIGFLENELFFRNKIVNSGLQYYEEWKINDFVRFNNQDHLSKIEMILANNKNYPDCIIIEEAFFDQSMINILSKFFYQDGRKIYLILYQEAKKSFSSILPLTLFNYDVSFISKRLLEQLETRQNFNEEIKNTNVVIPYTIVETELFRGLYRPIQPPSTKSMVPST